MSHTAHTPRHRKSRHGASRLALGAGVAGGVLSTLAVAGSSAPASASGPEAEADTGRLPVLTDGLVVQVAQATDATRQTADDYAMQAVRNAAETKAAREAHEAQTAAERKARAAAAKRAAAQAAASARATRSGERDTAPAPAPATTQPPAADAPSGGSVGSVLSFLNSQVGDAYVMGGTGPNSWDCSGLVQSAFRQVGVDLPRTSQDQSTAGTQVPLSSVRRGDILYWGSAGAAYHVAVYVGNGQYLDAANPSKGVVVQDLSGFPASGAVRVL